jgi:hypothetical protein
MSLDRARAVADAVLYEGYLLYPYRATSSKNQSRWQWGVLGPPGAAANGLGEEPDMSTSCLVRGGPDAAVRVHLRFLQLQARGVEARCVEAEVAGEPARYEPVAELRAGSRTWMSWDEAVAHEIELGPCPLSDLAEARDFEIEVPGGEDIEALHSDGPNADGVGRLVRRRRSLSAVVRVSAEPVDHELPPQRSDSQVAMTTSESDLSGGTGLIRLRVAVQNTAAEPAVDDKASAVAMSFIGTHLLLTASDAQFVSLLEPPDDAQEAVAGCEQRRCWPVLAGEPGQADVVLASPIILYDYPEVAEQSTGALFDSTEIDEILTLRVMTLTDEEKAAARATDPRAAEIIDRCDSMSPESMQALHGILRDPHAGVEDASLGALGSLDPMRDSPLPDMSDVPTFTELPAYTEGDIRNADPPTFDTGGAPWWDPAADAAVQPEADTVLVNGVVIGKGSLVRLRPSRRADAQDLFFAGEAARVTAVLSDVDGQVHVAVVLADDPAADIHEWYGRYLYFAPDELEPLGTDPTSAGPAQREESRP